MIGQVEFDMDRWSFGPHILSLASALAAATCDVNLEGDRQEEGVRVVSAFPLRPDQAGPSRNFRSSAAPQDRRYRMLARREFRDWRLKIDGLVQAPMGLSLDLLRAMRSRIQVAAYDGVGTGNAMCRWRGTQLRAVLAIVEPLANARYVILHCAHSVDGAGTRYFESIDLEEAKDPCTILAYDLDDKPLTVDNGAPLQLQIERLPGHTIAKYIMRIELVEHLGGHGCGSDGYWEDPEFGW
jgi:DMSO/TMAO reductase YedYZ molybdopterin-dependent catalytic subunit